MKLLYIILIVVASLNNTTFAQSLTANTFQQSGSSCPLMEVSIQTSQNANDLYTISYCNHGNATANNAYITIEINEQASIVTSTLAHSARKNNLYTFNIGNVAPSACAQFDIQIPTSSKIVQCTEVKIYPNEPCQAMIDQYFASQVSTGTTNTNNPPTNTNIAAVDANILRAAPAPITGNIINYVFEDHFILNTVPIGDSINNGPTGTTQDQHSSNDNNNNTLTVNTDDKQNASDDPVNDINKLFTAEHCRQLQIVNTNGHTEVDIHSTQTYQVLSTDPVVVQEVQETFGTPAVEYSEQAQIRIFPNPFSHSATIKFEGKTYKNLKLSIIDITGKTVRVQQEIPEQDELTIYKDDLSQGVYLYRLEQQDQLIHTGKIVVQ